jgi:predicted phage-related endonuclease
LELLHRNAFLGSMIDLHPDTKPNGFGRIGAQPIALAAVALAVVVTGAGSVALWRASAGSSPQQDRMLVARQLLQAQALQTSQQLVEKTKALDLSQQEAIDQLQALQDDVQTIKRAVAAQQNDSKRLSDEITSLTAAIDGLKQAFASVQSSETSHSSARPDEIRPKARARTSRRHSRSKG